jgi:hypothetical protein
MHVKLLQVNQKRWQQEVSWGLPAPHMQTRKDTMPLIKDVLNQMGVAKWLFVLDIQSGFWKINSEDLKNISFVTKFGLYDWLVMPFRLKNATTNF